jgi:hypothetical protein
MVVRAVAINPRESQLGKVNAILNGRGSECFVHDYPGPLSIKSVVRGEAVWQTGKGAFPLIVARTFCSITGSRTR